MSNTKKKTIGFVTDVKTDQRRTMVSVVLNYQELRSSELLLGQFIKVASGLYYKELEKTYLGMVTRAYYKPVAYNEHARSLALGHLNDEPLDEHAVRQMNFLHYDIAILGHYEANNGQYSFYPSTRSVPSLIDISIEHLPDEELHELINVTLNHDAGNEDAKQVALGFLQYGSNPDLCFTGVEKLVDVKPFSNSRTANFGKTGFGKSNENKAIVTLVAKNYPDTAFLVFDLNGEYAIQESDSTAKGLIDTFMNLDIKNRICFYTNRETPPVDNEIVKSNSLAVNFYETPELAIELAYKRELELSGSTPQYLEAVHASIHDILSDSAHPKNQSKLAYILGSFLAQGLEPPSGYTITYSKKTYNVSQTSERYELIDKLNEGAQGGDGETRKLYRFRNRLAFLNHFHTPSASGDIFKRIIKDIESQNIVIIDLPTLPSEMVRFFSTRLASELFNKALFNYSSGEKFNVVVAIEEAHNLLQDAHGIFYRLAKEGRKYGIGMLYSTQSPSAIPIEILSQTENFLVKHVSSEDDAKALKRAKAAFDEPISSFLLTEPVIGLSYIYMEPYQPFPVPIKVKLLEDLVAELTTEIR